MARFAKRIASASLLAMFAVAPAFSAALLRIPEDHNTITSAIAAASAGDTIVINDSRTYDESITWDKPLTIVAAPDMEPTIAGVAGSQYAVLAAAGSEGSRFGYQFGGTITINGDRCTSTSASKPLILRPSPSTTATLIVENVRVTDSHVWNSSTTAPSGTRDKNFMIEYGGNAANATGNVTMRYVSVEGGSHGLETLGTTSATLTLENCSFRVANFGAYFRGSQAEMIFNNCQFVSRLNVGLYYSTGTLGPHAYDGCLARTNGANAAVVTMAARRDRLTTMRNCVLITTGTGVVVPYSASSYRGDKWEFDHCDLIGRRPDAIIVMTTPNNAEAAPLGPDPNQPGLRSLTITNCNLVNPRGNIVATTGTRADLSFIAHHNNAFTTSTSVMPVFGPQAAFATYSVDAPVAAIMPDYADSVGFDFTYTNATLLTADANGGPVGSQGQFTASDYIVPVELSVFSLR